MKLLKIWSKRVIEKGLSILQFANTTTTFSMLFSVHYDRLAKVNDESFLEISERFTIDRLHFKNLAPSIYIDENIEFPEGQGKHKWKNCQWPGRSILFFTFYSNF